MKASDIPDEVFLAAVDRARSGGYASNRWDVTAVLAGHPELVGLPSGRGPFERMPAKVVLAKARKLIRRGLLEGCECGCRGDWRVR